MITVKISFQTEAQVKTIAFEWYLKKFRQNGKLKRRTLSEENKPTPSTNISLLSLRKSEQ